MLLTSRDNRLIKEGRRLLADSRYRRESGRFLIEGARLCADAAPFRGADRGGAGNAARRRGLCPGRWRRSGRHSAKGRARIGFLPSPTSWPAIWQTRPPRRGFSASAEGLTTAGVWIQ